jgi:ABC-type uncharacterized transport system permease subunit
MTVTLGALCIALYVGTAWRLASRLSVASSVAAPISLPGSIPFLAALVLHAILLWQVVVTDAGLNLGFFNAAALIGWVIATLVLITALTRSADSLGLFVLPLAAITVACVLFFPGEHFLSAELSSGVKTHVVVSVLAYGLLALAALQASLVWAQDRALRTKQFRSRFGALPALTSQESLLFQLMGLGFFFLSLSLVTGFMFVDDLLAQHLAHKTALSALAWCVFGVLLFGRWRHGWRGRGVVRWSLIGFGALMLAYFGAKLILELVLNRSWSA